MDGKKSSLTGRQLGRAFGFKTSGWAKHSGPGIPTEARAGADTAFEIAGMPAHASVEWVYWVSALVVRERCLELRFRSPRITKNLLMKVMLRKTTRFNIAMTTCEQPHKTCPLAAVL